MPVGIRGAFAVGVRHQWHQSWAGHSPRSKTAPSWKLRSHRKSTQDSLHLAISKFWPGGKLGELVYKLSFLSPGKANNTKSFQRDVLTLQHPASHHSSFYFAIPSYFPCTLWLLPASKPCPFSHFNEKFLTHCSWSAHGGKFFPAHLPWLDSLALEF